MKDIVLFGAGGSGREIAYLIEEINKTNNELLYNLLGFVDDDETTWGKLLNGYRVLGGSEWLFQNKQDVCVNVTIGTMDARRKVHENLINAGIHFETLIHPSVRIGPYTEIGAGCILNEGCEISCNVVIGDYCFLNNNTCLGHDDVLGKCVICNPHTIISGAVTIGNYVMMGGMSFVVQMSKIDDDVVVAPGSVVYGHIRTGMRVIGNPARKIKF